MQRLGTAAWLRPAFSASSPAHLALPACRLPHPSPRLEDDGHTHKAVVGHSPVEALLHRLVLRPLGPAGGEEPSFEKTSTRQRGRLRGVVPMRVCPTTCSLQAFLALHAGLQCKHAERSNAEKACPAGGPSRRLVNAAAAVSKTAACQQSMGVARQAMSVACSLCRSLPLPEGQAPRGDHEGGIRGARRQGVDQLRQRTQRGHRGSDSEPPQGSACSGPGGGHAPPTDCCLPRSTSARPCMC